MPTVQAAIDDFLAQKRIAVAGVSREPGGKHGGNIIYQRFKERGYDVFAVNPNADTVEGDPCYRSLAAIPGGVDAVVIATAPAVAPSVVEECRQLGITRVLMHRSIEAIPFARQSSWASFDTLPPPSRSCARARSTPPA